MPRITTSKCFKKQVIISSLQLPRLVDWLKSPDSHVSDPCSRLGGSSWLCYGIINYFIAEFNEMREIYFWRHLAWKAASKHLSEGELESTWPCSIQKYCRVQRNREFVPVQWEIGSHWPWSEIEAVSAVPHDNTELRQIVVNRGAIGESRTSGRRGKTPWGKPVSAINTVRKSQAASCWGPWNFRPSTAYDALTRILVFKHEFPGQWVGYILCCAWTPYLGWANEPRAE